MRVHSARAPVWQLDQPVIQLTYVFPFAAHRFFIISEIRFRVAADIVRRCRTPGAAVRLLLVPGGRARRLQNSSAAVHRGHVALC